MYKVWIKSVMVSLFGLAAFGLSQTAAADWEDGRCDPIPGTGSGAPCIEYQDSDTGNWFHFNGEGDHEDVWHGYAGTDGGATEEPFTFCGESALSCTVPLLGTIEFDCNLCLDGNVKKFQDSNGDWLVGVQVTDGRVTAGDSGCGTIQLSGFPWYAGDTNTHQGFGNNTGVPYTTPYTGNFGGIGITYLLSLVDDGHVHGVDFLNNGTSNTASEFAFGTSSAGGDDTIYENGNADDDSGCTVSGLLAVQSPAQDINIW